MKRGETKTFSYKSTTSTDQEVIIYHAQYIKALDNLSNLNPSSCILANARKLTNVEIHSNELYNINVTNNTFLRTINLEGCSTLGTVTATGSSLDLSNCKYLKYCNVYNTALTEVQLNTSGGSLVEILYPKTIQSINLIKQRLLEKIGLPYGSNGEEIPTSLYTISIQECPNIKYLNTSKNSAINTTFASMVYCNNLTIRNSLDLKRLTFDGFYRLKNVVIENMYNLAELGFNDLLPKGNASTVQYIGLSNCPLLEVLELNCTSDEYEITFANKAILNLGGLFGLKSIQSNCVLKGIETIVVPLNLESMFFTNEYGEGYSTIKNIWSSSVCTVNTAGATAKAQHVIPTYEGIDFAGMNLKNIDLGALVNIPKAINFTLYPTSVNPHFNLNRDGETYPYLQPEGTLDLSNYTESLARFFDGVDLDKLQIICNGKLPQTDLSYCFYNSSFSSNDAITTLLSKVSSITNLDYCFYRTTIIGTDILSNIKMGASSSMNYTFAECPNIKELSNIVIPSNATSVEGMFYKCPLTTITNMTVNVKGSISGLFKGCNKLTTINTLRIPNVTNVSGTFEGCASLSNLSGFELPDTCTNVSNLFNGCYMLTELSMNFGSNITAGDSWYPPNLETLNDTNIENGYVKMTNCSTLKNVNNLYINNGDYSDMFNGCPNLATLTLTMGSNITGLARFIKGCSKITSKPFIEIPDACVTIDEMFNGTNITDITGMTFGSKITSATDWLPIGLITANDVTIKNDNVKFKDCKTLLNASVTFLGTTSSLLFYGCDNLKTVKFEGAKPPFNNFKETFAKCYNLINVDCSNNDFSSVNNYGILYNTFQDLSPEAVINLDGCTFNFSNDKCGYLFYYSKCKKIIFTNVKFTSNTTSLAYMFTSGRKQDGTYYNFDTLREVDITGTNFSGISDMRYMFAGCTAITKDIIFPSTATNVEKAFYGCTKLTHVHSNWNNTYTGEITSTDCYAGCTAITHIDGENIIAYEGDNGLDYVSLDWGGNGFTKDVTTIMELEVLVDNMSSTVRVSQYTQLLSLNYTVAKINWGDGSPVELALPTGLTSSIPLHKYTKAGTYYIKAHICFGNGYAAPIRTSTNEARFTKILQVAKMYNGKPYYNFSYFIEKHPYLTYVDCSNLDVQQNSRTYEMFRDCSSLETVILPPNMKMGYTAGMFRGCSKLTEIRNYETWDMTVCGHASSMFQGCESLGNLDVSNWGMGGISTTQGFGVTYMFYGCKNMTYFDVSKWQTSTWNGCESIFDGTGIESIDLSNWQSFTKGLVTSKGINNMFRDCTKLKTVIGLENILDSNVKNISNLFTSCTSIIDFSFLEKCDFSEITNMQNVFNNTRISDFSFLNNLNVTKVVNINSLLRSNKNLTSITCPDWFKLSTITDSGALFADCSNLKEVHNLDWSTHFNLSDTASAYPCSVIEKCYALTTIEDINMDYTSILGTQHEGYGVTNDFWSGQAWNIFNSLNNLQNIKFTGTVTLYEARKKLDFFYNCDVSKFTLETWQSFVNTLPVTTGSYTIRVNKGLATIPDTIVSQITAKGYTLTT